MVLAGVLCVMWVKKTQKKALQLKETYPEYSKNLNCCDITFTPHIFRHTYATNLYYAKIDIKRTQYLMGHSSIEMTLKTYTHLDNLSSSNTVSETLNNFFSQSKISQIEFLAG